MPTARYERIMPDPALTCGRIAADMGGTRPPTSGNRTEEDRYTAKSHVKLDALRTVLEGSEHGDNSEIIDSNDGIGSALHPHPCSAEPRAHNDSHDPEYRSRRSPSMSGRAISASLRSTTASST
jgi:hypothetical protein